MHYDNSVKEVRVGCVEPWRLLRLLLVVGAYRHYCVAKPLLHDDVKYVNMNRIVVIHVCKCSSCGPSRSTLKLLLFCPRFLCSITQKQLKTWPPITCEQIFSCCYSCIKWLYFSCVQLFYACMFCISCAWILFSLMLCAVRAQLMIHIFANMQVLPRVLPWSVHPQLDLPLLDGNVRLLFITVTNLASSQELRILPHRCDSALVYSSPRFAIG